MLAAAVAIGAESMLLAAAVANSVPTVGAGGGFAGSGYWCGGGVVDAYELLAIGCRTR